MTDFITSSGKGKNMINIRRDVEDPFYRYKMPKIVHKVEGKGNGIKTVIPNLSEVGKALGRPPTYIIKYFGAELGSLSNIDKEANKYLVNGVHDAEKLQGVLDGFISKFVLCPQCDNPETNLSISKKDGTIYRTCQACGNKAPVDMLHKLVSFIRANPPPKAPKKKQAKDRVEELDQSGLMDENAKSGGGEKEQVGIVAPDDFDEALKNVNVDNVDEDDWAEAEASEAIQGEMDGLPEQLKKNLVLGEKKENVLDPSLEAFGDYLLRNRQATNNQIIAEIKHKEIEPKNALVVIIQTLFDAENFPSTFAQRTLLIKELAVSEREQRYILGAVERLVSIHHPALLDKICTILQAFYNEDLLDEEVLIKWKGKISKRWVDKKAALLVRERSEPFFQWLDQASSDEDEDESD